MAILTISLGPSRGLPARRRVLRPSSRGASALPREPGGDARASGGGGGNARAASRRVTRGTVALTTQTQRRGPRPAARMRAELRIPRRRRGRGRLRCRRTCAGGEPRSGWSSGNGSRDPSLPAQSRRLGLPGRRSLLVAHCDSKLTVRNHAGPACASSATSRGPAGSATWARRPCARRRRPRPELCTTGGPPPRREGGGRGGLEKLFVSGTATVLFKGGRGG